MSEIGEEKSNSTEGSGSAEHYFSFDNWATKLGVPKEHWEDPTVREFVGFIQSTHDLELTLSEAGTRVEQQPTAEETALPLDPSLWERYERAALLVRVARLIMSDGVPYPHDAARFAEELAPTLKTALRGYAIEIGINWDKAQASGGARWERGAEGRNPSAGPSNELPEAPPSTRKLNRG